MPSLPDTHVGRRLAGAAYRATLISPEDGREIIVFSARPIEEAARDLLRAAIRHAKPVPSVQPCH
jgi:hypothetical protein